MPKKSNNEVSADERAPASEQVHLETQLDHGETGVATESNPNSEPHTQPEQVESSRYLEQNKGSTTGHQAQLRERQNNQLNSWQPNNGFSNQSGYNQPTQAGYAEWGQKMQTQFNPMQDQPKSNFSSAGHQRGAGLLHLIDFGDAKRVLSLLGGAYLAIYGLSRSLGSLTLAGAGVGLLYYAMTGRWPLAGQGGEQQTHPLGRNINNANPVSAIRATTDTSTTTKNIIVKAPLPEVYQAWANFENFPHFMQYIKSVRKTGERTSHWTMEGPFNTQIEWDAETTRLEENSRIAWNSITGDIKTSGQVTFNPLQDDEVEVTVMLKYVPPAGLAGNIVAELFSNPEAKLLADLRNFKHYIEQRQPQPA